MLSRMPPVMVRSWSLYLNNRDRNRTGSVIGGSVFGSDSVIGDSEETAGQVRPSNIPVYSAISSIWGTSRDALEVNRFSRS